ncbi:MAG TPA: hypothetical protein VHX43_02285 [Xanthobacteraceae bacterium]|nr:hypothetical protein [Xanthobacteraceae bacterium]
MPLLLMPPPMVALPVTAIPLPEAEIVPAFDTVPVTVLLLMVMPVLLGGPFIVVMAPPPAFVTLPLIVELEIKMHEIAPGLLTLPWEAPTTAMPPNSHG